MKTMFNEFTVSATMLYDKPSPWDSDNWNNYRVTVYDTETRKRTAFDFWASIASPKLETEYDILNAFYCFVSDALSGQEAFPDFCQEFGYDEDSRTAEKTWKACRRALAKFQRVTGYNENQLYQLIEELGEKYA